MHVDFKTAHIDDKSTYVDEGFPILLRAFSRTASHLSLRSFTASPLSKCTTHEPQAKSPLIQQGLIHMQKRATKQMHF